MHNDTVSRTLRGGFNRYLDGRVDPLPCPPLVAIWSGSSAATGPRVQQYLGWSSSERRGFVADSDAILASWEQNPVHCLEATRVRLEAAMAAAGVDYRTPALDRIAQLARKHGGAAKPSGAGGGDVAVAVIPDPDDRQAFAEACSAEGLPPIAVQVVAGVDLD